MGRGAKVGRGGRETAEKRQKCKLASTSQAVYFPKTARSAGWQSNVSHQMCDFNASVSKSCSSSFWPANEVGRHCLSQQPGCTPVT